MGLKWFRARLTMNRAPKKTTITSVAGFYRSTSQFDNDVQPPQSSTSQERHTVQNLNSTSTSPGPMSVNPMAGLSNRKNVLPRVPRDIVSKPTKSLENDNEQRLSKNDDMESPDHGGPRHLPRESIELMRETNADTSFQRVGSRSRKIDFKKKKGRAPIPKMATSSAEGDERFIKIGNNRGSDASEIEI